MRTNHVLHLTSKETVNQNRQIVPEYCFLEEGPQGTFGLKLLQFLVHLVLQGNTTVISPWARDGGRGKCVQQLHQIWKNSPDILIWFICLKFRTLRRIKEDFCLSFPSPEWKAMKIGAQISMEPCCPNCRLFAKQASPKLEYISSSSPGEQTHLNSSIQEF